MKTKTGHILGWKQVYIALIMLILLAIILRYSRQGSSESTFSSSQDPYIDSSLSAQDQLKEASTLGEDQFIEPSSAAEDLSTESSPDALEVASDNVSVFMKPEGQFEGKSAQATMTEETENKEQNFDPPPMSSTMSDSSDGFEVAPDNVSVSIKPEGLLEENSAQATMTEETENKELKFDPPPPPPPPPMNSTMSNSSVCNYAKGKWVADSRRPFYSGLKCKRWLPTSWACRRTQRDNFDYEGYRWQPSDCGVPEFDRFAFLTKMQDKTIAFIGDSLGRQQFHSLMCMATGGEDSPDIKDVGTEYGLVKRPGAIRPDGWAYRFATTNTTILFYWSSTLCRLERMSKTNPNSSLALHLDRVPTFLSKFLCHFHVLVLNTAHHWLKAKFIANHWVMHVNGKPIKDGMLMDMINVKNFTVHRVVKWLDSQLPLHQGLKAFFRNQSPRHIIRSEFDKVVETAVKGTKVKILDITALSSLRNEAHKSQHCVSNTSALHDCLHWCLPGVPDTWNELMVAQL